MTHTTELADFDAFFAERRAEAEPGARLRLYGREYELPRQAPLTYVLLAEANRDRSDVQALREVLEPLFGPDALDEWAAAGMGDTEFQTLLHWAAANMQAPGSLSIAEAAEQVSAAESGKALVPANRAELRAAVRKTARTSGVRS